MACVCAYKKNTLKLHFGKIINEMSIKPLFFVVSILIWNEPASSDQLSYLLKMGIDEPFCLSDWFHEYLNKIIDFLFFDNSDTKNKVYNEI